MNWTSTNCALPVHGRSAPAARSRDNFFGLVDDLLKDWRPIRTSFIKDEFHPALSVSETPESYIVEAELPGVKKADVSVDFQDGVLTLKGEKNCFDEEKKGQYHRFERSHGSFTRSIQFPTDADPELVKAKMEDGVLRVEISKTKETEKQKRSIEIA